MEEFIYFFILILSLFLSFAGLYIPLLGLLGVFISLGVVVPQIPLLTSDPSYMLFSAIIVLANCFTLLLGYRRSGKN
jgi:hypothetical protein